MGKDSRYDLDGADDGLGEAESPSASATSTDPQRETAGSSADADSDGNSDNSDGVPHRVRYDSPQKNRQPLNLHISTEDKRRLRDLTTLAEEEFEETVWDTDVKLAMFRCDISDDESFLAEMRNIGYGYFD